MDDVSEFLQFYNEQLDQEIAEVGMPVQLLEQFAVDSCVKKRADQAVYYVTRKNDGMRGVLRVTDSGAGENPASGGDAGVEAAILRNLDHPAIPKLLDGWVQDNGRGFAIREYFDGDDLAVFVKKRGPLDRGLLEDIALQLCDVLQYIHSQNPPVIHRDIKPENIVIAEKNRIKLIDFGIARDFDPDAEWDTHVAGTRPYMAPEQFGSEQTDGRADIYSLGVVMIFMATGSHDKEKLKAVYPYKELIPLIAKCIKKDRAQRFGSAAQLKRRILRVKRRVTRKVLLVVAACVAIAVAFALGAYVGQSQGFERGVEYIMNIPLDKNRSFTAAELNQPVTFGDFYIDLAVRDALNKPLTNTITGALSTDAIYLSEVQNISEIRIYGTNVLYPSQDDTLTKTSVSKDVVSYTDSSGLPINTRGDISSLSDIPKMYYLRTLSLTSQSISDLTPLSGMKLDTLVLCDNFIGNLLPLCDMVTLTYLDLCQNPLADLTPISKLLSLNYLDISQTQVTSLKPLAALTKLQTLNMEYCDVKDISVLAKLKSLTYVDLSNTLVTDLDPLVHPDNPVTVRCVGLPKAVLDKVRGKSGIVLVEE